MKRPYITRILARKGKTVLLPLPFKMREILEAVKGLGIKSKADEDEMDVIGYKALYIPAPIMYLDTLSEIERVADKLAGLSEEQVRALGQLCKAFNLYFCHIDSLLEVAQEYTEVQYEGE
jgi:hypothetical protein